MPKLTKEEIESLVRPMGMKGFKVVTENLSSSEMWLRCRFSPNLSAKIKEKAYRQNVKQNYSTKYSPKPQIWAGGSQPPATARVSPERQEHPRGMRMD